MDAAALAYVESSESMQRRVLRFHGTVCDSPRWDADYAERFERMWDAAVQGDALLLRNLMRSCNERLIDQLINDSRYHGHFQRSVSGTIDPAR